jgi:hypothetical protein
MCTRVSYLMSDFKRVCNTKSDDDLSASIKNAIAIWKERINVKWKSPWYSGGFLDYQAPLVYIACNGQDCCHVAIFESGTLKQFRQMIHLWKNIQKYSAKFVDSYRSEGDENNPDDTKNGTNVYIVERMDDTLYNFFQQLLLKLNDGKTREEAEIEATTEINKIFNLVKNMNNDLIFHRDANAGNIMYIKTPYGLVWKFIDPETVYLAKEDFYIKTDDPEDFVNITTTVIKRDLIDRKYRDYGLNIDVLNVAISFVMIDKIYHKFFPEWVKQRVKDAKKTVGYRSYLDLIP